MLREKAKNLYQANSKSKLKKPEIAPKKILWIMYNLLRNLYSESFVEAFQAADEYIENYTVKILMPHNTKNGTNLDATKSNKRIHHH